MENNTTARQTREDVDFTKQMSQLANWLRVMIENGLRLETLQRQIDDPRLRRDLVRFIMSGCYHPSESELRAREIMGVNFFGVEENYLCYVPALNVGKTQTKVPYSEEMLQRYADDYLLMYVPPVSILQIYNSLPNKNFFQDTRSNRWYDHASFSQDQEEFGWHLIKKEPLAFTEDKAFAHQSALLVGTDKKVPSARVLVFAIIYNRIMTGEKLFSNFMVRTNTVLSNGNNVTVGNIHGSLVISHDEKEKADPFLSLGCEITPDLVI